MVQEVGGGVTEKEEKEEEKIPLCESIGHRPLRGRCPKTTTNYTKTTTTTATTTIATTTTLKTTTT